MKDLNNKPPLNQSSIKEQKPLEAQPAPIKLATDLYNVGYFDSVKNSMKSFFSDSTQAGAAATSNAKGTDSQGNACECPGGSKEEAAKSEVDSKQQTQEAKQEPGQEQQPPQSGETEAQAQQPGEQPVEGEQRLTVEQIEEMGAAAAGGTGTEGGFEVPPAHPVGHEGLVTSTPRDLGIARETGGLPTLFIPVIPEEPLETEVPKVCPPPPDARDECFKVFEKGLPCGSDNDPDNPCKPCKPAPTCVSGNVLANDVMPVPATITKVTFEGTDYFPDADGVISIDTGNGLLTLYTKDFNGKDAGDFKYELLNAADHPDGNCINKIAEVFTYTLVSDGACDPTKGDTADLTIKIIDDVPKAINDKPKCVTGCEETISGNVLCNDVAGADKPTKVTAIKYDNGCSYAEIGDCGYVTVKTKHGGCLTVYDNGDWEYTSPDHAKKGDCNSCENQSFSDGFSYIITDRDGDSSCAKQPIEVTLPAPPEAHDDGACGQYVVFESGLACGSDNDCNNPCRPPEPKPTCVTGNVLENDCLPNPACITKVTFDCVDYTPNYKGIITIDTGVGVLTLYTKDAYGHEAGDFKYELKNPTEHPDDCGKNNIEQIFKYTLEGKDDCECDTSQANLFIKIVDDVPKAIDDPTKCVEDCKQEISGNVLCNDVKGADKYTKVISFTFNDGKSCAVIGDCGFTSVITAIGGCLTVYDNGDWEYVSPKDIKCDKVEDGFVYTIKDHDGDTSCASQPILVKDSGSYNSNEDCDKPRDNNCPVVCDDNKPTICDDEPNKPPRDDCRQDDYKVVVCEPKCEDKAPSIQYVSQQCKEKDTCNTACDDKEDRRDHNKWERKDHDGDKDNRHNVSCKDKHDCKDDKNHKEHDRSDHDKKHHKEWNDCNDKHDDRGHHSKGKDWNNKDDDRGHHSKDKNHDKYNSDCHDKCHDKNDNHEWVKGHHESRHGNDCGPKQPICGNVFCDGEGRPDNCKVNSFHCYNEHNRFVECKPGESIWTNSGGHLTISKNGDYSYTPKDHNKSFCEFVQFDCNDCDGKDERSSFCIHTSDIKPDYDELCKQACHDKCDDNYIVDISEVGSGCSISMNDCGVNYLDHHYASCHESKGESMLAAVLHSSQQACASACHNPCANPCATPNDVHAIDHHVQCVQQECHVIK